MIEVLKLAIDYIENVPDDRDNVGHIDRKALVLSLNQSIKEWESQEPLGFMNAGQVLEMQQGECPYVYVYPKQKSGASVAIYTHPPQRKCENCGEFGTCCLKTESQEQNFCPRCGKRTNHIHTCTPPRDNT